MRTASGFSLLEVLAALALLALLLLGVYSGVRVSSVAVKRGTAAIDRLDEIRSAREFLRRELTEATTLPWMLNAKGDPVVFDGSARAMRFVAPLPGYLGKEGMQVVNVRVLDDSQEGQHMEVDFSPLPTGVGRLPSMAPEPLLTGMHAISFRYADRNGVWTDQWHERSSLPTLIGIDAGEATAKSWPSLLVAPRQSPWALDPASIGRALRKADEP